MHFKFRTSTVSWGLASLVLAELNKISWNSQTNFPSIFSEEMENSGDTNSSPNKPWSPSFWKIWAGVWSYTSCQSDSSSLTSNSYDDFQFFSKNTWQWISLQFVYNHDDQSVCFALILCVLQLRLPRTAPRRRSVFYTAIKYLFMNGSFFVSTIP